MVVHRVNRINGIVMVVVHRVNRINGCDGGCTQDQSYLVLMDVMCGCTQDQSY